MPTSPHAPIRLRLLAAAAGTLSVLSSCAVPSGELPQAPAPPQLPGSSGIVLAEAVNPAALFAYDLSTQQRVALRLPPDTEEVVHGHWVDEGAAVVAVRGSEGVAAYRVAASVRPEAIGESIRATRFDSQQGALLASSCRYLGGGAEISPGRFRPSGPDRQTGQVHLLDLDADEGWRRVAKGCVAALSPDGEQVVHSPEGLTLWVSDPGEGSTRKLLDVRDLNLESESGKPFTIKGPIDWSEGGIAVAIDADGSDTLVRLSTTGEVQEVIPVHPQRRDFFIGLTWSPDGNYLAIPAYTYLGYVNATGSLLLAEEGAGGFRVLSVQPFASGNAVWAPDGKSVLLRGDRTDPWIVTNREGTWLQRVPRQDAVPLDWRQS